MDRTLLRHRDLRLVLPGTPGIERDERDFAKGRYFEADCLATDVEGDLVHMTGPKISGFAQVTRADPRVDATMPILGVIESKSASTRCLIQTMGEFSQSGLLFAKHFYVGNDGRLSASPPTAAPGGIVVNQLVAQGLDDGLVLLTPHLMVTKGRGQW